VTISAMRHRHRVAMAGFAVVTVVLFYALVKNIIDKPDGIAISGMFIAGIITVSLISRVARTTELRAERLEFDEVARRLITESIEHDGQLNLIANRRQAGDVAEYAGKELEQRRDNPVPGAADVLFLEIDVVDPSEFSGTLTVRGAEVDGHRILRTEAPAAPNAIAAILLALRDTTGERPHCYFAWAEGSPLVHMVRYFLLGRGDTAPVTREIIRKHEPDPARRPGIHVGSWSRGVWRGLAGAWWVSPRPTGPVSGGTRSHGCHDDGVAGFQRRWTVRIIRCAGADTPSRGCGDTHGRGRARRWCAVVGAGCGDLAGDRSRHRAADGARAADVSAVDVCGR